jgi:hypothetical protein
MAVNPEKKGTKAAAHYRLTVNPGACQVVRLRLSDLAPAALAQTNGEAASPFGSQFAEVLQARRQEADEFYAAIIPAALDADAANVMRQALAGMLWSKQFYHYDVDKWLEERGSDPFKPTRKAAPRNDSWHHMYNGDVISMPDKWEYPWYAAWDLAFHVLALSRYHADHPSVITVGGQEFRVAYVPAESDQFNPRYSQRPHTASPGLSAVPMRLNH